MKRLAEADGRPLESVGSMRLAAKVDHSWNQLEPVLDSNKAAINCKCLFLNFKRTCVQTLACVRASVCMKAFVHKRSDSRDGTSGQAEAWRVDASAGGVIAAMK